MRISTPEELLVQVSWARHSSCSILALNFPVRWGTVSRSLFIPRSSTSFVSTLVMFPSDSVAWCEFWLLKSLNPLHPGICAFSGIGVCVCVCVCACTYTHLCNLRNGAEPTERVWGRKAWISVDKTMKCGYLVLFIKDNSSQFLWLGNWSR